MKKILCFGDSNTWGHNPADCSKLERPWPVVLDELLGDCEIIQEGECGRNTMFGDPEKGFKNGLAAFQKLIRTGTKADLAIVMLGTNDTLNELDRTPKESAEALRQYVIEWKKAFPHSDFLVVSPIEEREEVLSHEIFGALYSAKSLESSRNFARYYEQVAQEEDVYFLDAAKYARASAIDGVHMEPQEHEKLARAVCEKVKEIFKETQGEG